MKEATGELNMTVITVVAIAAVAAFFYAFVWPNIKTSITRGQKCSQISYCEPCEGKNCTCYYCDKDVCEDSDYEKITCPNSDKTETTEE